MFLTCLPSWYKVSTPRIGVVKPLWLGLHRAFWFCVASEYFAFLREHADPGGSGVAAGDADHEGPHVIQPSLGSRFLP